MRALAPSGAARPVQLPTPRLGGWSARRRRSVDGPGFRAAECSSSVRPPATRAASNQGWYSYNVGDWHIISLNIECRSAAFGNDCSTTDGGLLAQETGWLARDLAANRASCTLAYWHQPTFTAADTTADVANPSAPGADSPEGVASDAWWKLLYQAHATLVLNGHEHYYARFRPMNPAGQYDPRHGITQITIGTGGEALDTLAREANGAFSNPNVVTAQDEAFGVMKLTLHPDSFSWDYQPALAGPAADTTTAMSYRDTGTARCQGSGGHSGQER